MCASAKITSACCAPSRSPHVWDSPSSNPFSRRSGRLRHEIATARRRVCSRSTTRFFAQVQRTPPSRPGRRWFPEPISSELHNGAGEALWQALERIDSYRRKVPVVARYADQCGPARHAAGATRTGSGAGTSESRREADVRPRPVLARLGNLPLHAATSNGSARFSDCSVACATSPPACGRSALTHRSIFREALTWLEIHGGIRSWSSTGFPCSPNGADEPVGDVSDVEPGDRPRRRRRRRRRRPFRPAQ